MATTFHQFDELPPELQHKIWKCALLQPREVEIFLEYSKTKRARIFPFEITIDYYFSTTPCPPLLHTYRASRAFAKRQYIPLFGSIAPKVTETTIMAVRIYFNPEIDTICCQESDIPTHRYRSHNWRAIRLLKVILDAGTFRRFVRLDLGNRNLRRVELYAHESWLGDVKHELQETELECRIPRLALFEEESGALHCEVGPTYDGIELWQTHDVPDSSKQEYDYDVNFGRGRFREEREGNEDGEETFEEDEWNTEEEWYPEDEIE